jgi:hypothetical protein
MQVEVVEVAGDGRVVVKGPYGTFTAGWDGEPPEPGSRHDVELDVGGVALWGDDIEVADSGVNELADDGSVVRVAGRIVDFGADDVLVLDAGGVPVMVDTDGDPPLGIIDRHAVLRAREVTLYPYDL